MGYDPFQPISLAQVNVLCVPAGHVTPEKFEEFLRAFRSFSIISSKRINGSSSFSTFRDGQILLNVGSDIRDNDTNAESDTCFNSKPQVIIGFVDGERLRATQDGDRDAQLRSIYTGFNESGTNISEDAVYALVVLGGDQIRVFEGCYFVDLEGDGPSLNDVTQQVLQIFLSQLEKIARDLATQPSGSTVNTNVLQSSSTTNSDQPADLPKTTKASTNDTAEAPWTSGDTGNEIDTASARTAVLIGQLNLQAGQWPEALRYFSDGAITARNKSDSFWFATALEGLLTCMILFAWAHLDFNVPRICYPAVDKKGPIYSFLSMSNICAANQAGFNAIAGGKSTGTVNTLTLLIPHLLNFMLALYEKSTSISQEDSQLRLFYQYRIRWGNLLLHLKENGSALNDMALQSIVKGADVSSSHRTKDSPNAILILHTQALTRLFLDVSLGAQSQLSSRRAAPFQLAVASSLSRLGVDRKQAFHLRGFLQKLGPALVEARRLGAAEVGVHPSASLPALDVVPGNTSGTRRSGIEAFLESICESYGLPRTRSPPEGTEISPLEALRNALQFWSTAHQAGDVFMRADILNLCIEVADSVPHFHCSLNLMSRLLQVSIQKPTLNTNSANAAPSIPDSEQSRLVSGIRRSAISAARFGIPDCLAQFWDKCLVRHIEVSENSTSNRLIPRTSHDLLLVSSANSEAKKDPFIFNPFARVKSGASPTAIVVGEQARFNVVLQNPLQVDVEIEDIVLLAEGCDFQPAHHGIVLGPLCSQAFTLTGKALQTGDLVIRGCRATIRGCHPEDFLIVHGDWKSTTSAKQASQLISTGSVENVALPEIKTISLRVTTPLPNLSITSTSLLQQSVMLLEGEKMTFTITLGNDANVDADFVLLTFEDSVTRRLEDAMSNRDLLAADLFEIQNQIASRPVIRLVEGDNDEARIPAHGSSTFTLELFGRPGLVEVVILVNYTHLGRPRSEVQQSFYTRQLRHTITTTINGSIDIPRCSVLPLESDLQAYYAKHEESEDQGVLSCIVKASGDDKKQCIMLLDVRNIWPRPLIVDFEASQISMAPDVDPSVWEASSKISEILQPGQMTRLLLLAPRLLIDDPYVPIPSLDIKRQFVVSTSKMTMEAEAAIRESFWYRENLLRCLKASWKEQNGSRWGQIDMRKGIRLSSRMIDALRIDLVETSFTIRPDGKSAQTQYNGTCPVKQVASSLYMVARNEFATLITTVHNRSKEELRLLVRLQISLRNQPHNIALDLSKRFAWSGVLQRALQPPLRPNETRQFELGIIGLTEGEYQINGTAEEIRSRKPKTESTTLEVGTGVERRMWPARRPCMIDIVESRTC